MIAGGEGGVACWSAGTTGVAASRSSAPDAFSGVAGGTGDGTCCPSKLAAGKPGCRSAATEVVAASQASAAAVPAPSAAARAASAAGEATAAVAATATAAAAAAAAGAGAWGCSGSRGRSAVKDSAASCGPKSASEPACRQQNQRPVSEQQTSNGRHSASERASQGGNACGWWANRHTLPSTPPSAIYHSKFVFQVPLCTYLCQVRAVWPILWSAAAIRQSRQRGPPPRPHNCPPVEERSNRNQRQSCPRCRPHDSANWDAAAAA